MTMTPHEWVRDYATTADVERCAYCSVQMVFDPRTGVRVFYMDHRHFNSYPFRYAGEPQCRREEK